MWAVWHSGIMQKIAKYQMNELKIFGGLFIPYISKKMRDRIAFLKKKKNKKELKKIKISVAILGGGDIVFPAITSGVFLKFLGIVPALFVVFGAFFGLFILMLYSEKKKFYPAMPFITAGIFMGLLLWVITCAI
jgi:UDP-N-acetylglucosamine:LPS N-acetylglucosamine transferase